MKCLNMNLNLKSLHFTVEHGTLKGINMERKRFACMQFRGLSVFIAALTALKQGKSIGILIDQNTRVRDGGEFVDFFGLPVPSSTAPAALKRYCDAHNVPAVIIFGSCPRLEDGRSVAHIEYLSKPFEQYADDREVIQELMVKAEADIRRYPDQYLWFYKRFQYICPDASEEVKKKYPAYAVEPSAAFFNRTAKKNKGK